MADDLDPFDTEAKWLQRSALDDRKLLSRLPWGELMAFLAVAKLGSINRAATYLGINNRRLSQQVQHLQDAVGSQIFVQSRSGTRLTERGLALANFLVRFDRDLSALTSDLSVESSQAEGSVRLTITDGLGMVFAAPSMRAFSKVFPKIQIHLKTPVNYRQLADNQTDMMLGFVPESGKDVVTSKLGRLHLLPMVSRSYVEQFGMPTLSNIAEHRFVDSEQYSSQSGIYEPWHKLVARGRISHFCDTSFSYAMLVKCGLGIGLLSNYAIAEPAFIPLELNVHVQLQLYLVALKERLRSKPVRIAFDHFCKVFGESNRWFGREMILDPGLIQDPSTEAPALFVLERLDAED